MTFRQRYRMNPLRRLIFSLVFFFFLYRPAQLDQILTTLDGRLKLRFSNGKLTEEIVQVCPALVPHCRIFPQHCAFQALTLVHHCLLQGSEEFVDHYRTMKATFITFKDHRNSRVSSHAKPIASLLDDYSRLKRERDRAILGNRSS